MSPVLSIITVTCNCVATLEKTLRSVQAIKTEEMEYIIIDGVSTDGTLELVRRYCGLIDILKSEPDTGIYNAMNKGVAQARGDYVLFINGDDELVADGFSSAMKALRARMGDVVCTSTVVGRTEVPDEVLIAKPWHLLFFNSIPHPSSFTRRELLQTYPFREDLRIASDYDFFLKTYLDRRSYYVLPVVTALHQRGGASGNTQLSLAEVEKIRRSRLGWGYSLLNLVLGIYRALKLGRTPI